MLFLHQLLDQNRQVLLLTKIDIGRFFGGQDRTATVQESDDLRTLDAAVLGLHVVDLTFVPEIVVKSNDHSAPENY